MPKETIYGGEAFALEASTRNEYPLLEIPPGTIYTVCQRGLSVHWGKGVDSVELGVSMVETSSGNHYFESGEPFPGAFTHMDQQSMAAVIRVLKRAARQSFGDVPW